MKTQTTIDNLQKGNIKTKERQTAQYKTRTKKKAAFEIEDGHFLSRAIHKKQEQYNKQGRRLEREGLAGLPLLNLERLKNYTRFEYRPGMKTDQGKNRQRDHKNKGRPKPEKPKALNAWDRPALLST